MKRTQIQLSEEDYRRLREIAARLGRSMADCIREGIGLFLRRIAGPEDDLSDIAGAFHALPLEGLKDHDRWLAQTHFDPPAEQ